MKFQSVTVFKLKNGVWERKVFKKAYVRFKDALMHSSGGRNNAAKAVIRIFDGGADIETGDKVMLGSKLLAEPAPEAALTVYEISDNTCLKRRAHYRVSAG